MLCGVLCGLAQQHLGAGKKQCRCRQGAGGRQSGLALQKTCGRQR